MKLTDLNEIENIRLDSSNMRLTANDAPRNDGFGFTNDTRGL